MKIYVLTTSEDNGRNWVILEPFFGTIEGLLNYYCIENDEKISPDDINKIGGYRLKNFELDPYEDSCDIFTIIAYELINQ